MSIKYADYEYSVAALQLVLAMVGMGATLTLGEFRRIIRRPFVIGFVLLVQFLAGPLLAIALGRLFALPPGITVGLVIVAAMPSGALSNIFTYLGLGNVPLSITATCASTVSCLLVAPLVIQTLAFGELSSELQMPTRQILTQLLCFLLLPLAGGLAIHHYWPKRSQLVSRWSIRGSLVFMTLLIVGSLTSGRIDVLGYGLKIPAVVALFGLLVLVSVQLLSKGVGFNSCDAFTLGIETMMRNCNAAILVVASLFPAGQSDATGGAALYVALFYGGAVLAIGAVPIMQRRIKGRD